MPAWEIHNKWAEKIGISTDVSNYVNRMIDFPEQDPEFLRFCDDWDKEVLQSKRRRNVVCIPITEVVGKHDVSRQRKTAAYIQLEFLRRKGKEYVRAWYLHHALDYIERAPLLTVEEVLERLEKRTQPDPELEEVKRFVKDNSREILKNCRRCQSSYLHFFASKVISQLIRKNGLAGI
ncbi:MAG: hypothetical protein QXO16_00415 [Archaeoglobaceae archaeon]